MVVLHVRTKQRLLPANIGKEKTGAVATSTLLGSKKIAQRRVDIALGEKVFLYFNLFFNTLPG